MNWNIDNRFNNYFNNYINNWRFNCIPYQFQIPLLSFNRIPFQTFKFNYTSQSANNDGNSVNDIGITNKQKAQIEEISKMKYDSENLRTKLDENKDINSYAKYLENNKDYTLRRTINSDDGGKIYLYEDANGNVAGSVRKNANGKIDNVSLDLNDGGRLSLNDSNSDGTVDSRFAMSAQYDVDANKDTFDYALSQILKHKPGYKAISEKRSDGTVCERYTKNGQEFAIVIKDGSGKILSLVQSNVRENSVKSQKFFYTDVNGNGIIDDGDGKTRFDINLS